jgi:hypothetical protein
MTEAADPGCCRLPDECAFAKAVLSRGASCELARREPRGVGEYVACVSSPARIDCSVLVALLRERSSLALKLRRGPLLHTQALKLQCGGVAGLRKVLEAGHDDVHRLVAQAQERWGSVANLPWQEVVRDVAAWQARRRTPRG